MRISDALVIFLKDLNNKGRSSGTLKEYHKDILMFERFLPYESVEQVTLSDINSFLNFQTNKRDYKSSSRNRLMNSIRSFFKFCKKMGLLRDNPAEFTERLPEEQVERTFLTVEEMNQLLEAIQHDLVKLVVYTLFFTGARIHECLQLELDDLDFEQKTVRIKRGKGGKLRILPLHPQLEPLLQDYIQRWRVVTKSTKLFLTQRSGGLSDAYINRILKDTVERLGWSKKVTCHVFRHSFASSLVQSNVHIVVIKELLGHANVRTTSGYAHVHREDQGEAMQRLHL